MAAALEEAGFDSLIYNADYDYRKKTILGNTNHLNVKSLTELSLEYDRRLNDNKDKIWREIYDYINNYQPGILIISVFSTTLTAGNKIAGIAKGINPKIKVVFEGCTNRGLHCAVDPSVNADPVVMDFAIRREPEQTIVELAKSISAGGKDLHKIKGLSWKDANGNIIHNEDRPPIENIDQLPFPARHRIDGYKKIPPHAFQGIYGSRGCPFDCIFCGCHTSWGYKPRLRSAENMIDEIEYVFERFGTRYFYICDDIFFIDKERAHKFCSLLIKKKLPVYWSGQTRAEMVDDQILSMMKKSGGQHVAVGVEVGNPQIRQLIKKGNTVDDVRRCSGLIKKHGLRMVAFCMVGLPWEGPEEIQDTLDLVKEIDPYIVYPYLPTPAAGTELAKLVLQKNPEGFTKYRDRCHIDISSALTDKLMSQEKKEVIEHALAEFVKINRKNLLTDILKRPGFYFALANDMGFIKNPAFFFNYLKDYLA